MDDIELLNHLANLDTCDGDCDDLPPHKECPECIALRALNEIGEIRDYAIRDIKKDPAYTYTTIKERLK